MAAPSTPSRTPMPTVRQPSVTTPRRMRAHGRQCKASGSSFSESPDRQTQSVSSDREGVAFDVLRDEIEEQADVDGLMWTARVIGAQGPVEGYLLAEEH